MFNQKNISWNIKSSYRLLRWEDCFFNYFGERKYKIMEGIRARNTTGYDATRRGKTFIEYRKDETYEYEEVRRVNTKKPGDYRITYKLTDEIGRKTSVRVIHKVLKKK